MNSYPKIFLKKGKEISLQRRHHWIFSGAIAQKEEVVSNGQIVQVLDHKGELLAIGYFSEGSIMVRILSFKDVTINTDFWLDKIRDAYSLRKTLGLVDNDKTNVYRLVHAEGDLLPGLIIDFYNGTAVIQAHHEGIYNHLADISYALQQIYGTSLNAIFDKSSETIHSTSIETENRLIFGHPNTEVVSEHGNKFEIDWQKGQKTGFFIDQRENRNLLSYYSKGKKVLNSFCYSGGFSVYAISGGAKEVHSVDISPKAIQLTNRNLHLNGFGETLHISIEADVIKYIREINDDFDVIVLDPPAFAKNIRSKHKAVQAYKRLNAEAIKHIKTGGVLFTFSCSQVVDTNLFHHTIRAAAMEVGRKVKILHFLSQSADHPINIYHPETSYLKGLVLYVE